MANVGGVAQLMETVGTSAPQTASTSTDPAQSFATVMQQANTDAGVPPATPAPAAKSASASVAPPATDAENGSKQENLGQTASPSSIPAAGTSEAGAKLPSPVPSPTHALHYTSANLLAGLLTRSGNQTAPVAAQSVLPKTPAANTAPGVFQAESRRAAPLADQALPATVTSVPPAVSAPPASLNGSSAPSKAAAVEIAPPSTSSASSSSPVTAYTGDGKAAVKPSAASSRQTVKPEVSVASSATALAPLPNSVSSAPAMQVIEMGVPPAVAATQVQAAAADNAVASTQTTIVPTSAKASTGVGITVPGPAQMQKHLAPEAGLVPGASGPSGLPTGMTQPLPTSSAGITVANGMPAPAADAARFTPAITAWADGSSALQTPSQPVATGAVAEANALPPASANPVKVGSPATLPPAAVRQSPSPQTSAQTSPQTSPQISTTAAATPQALPASSATNAPVAQQAAVPLPQTNAPAPALPKSSAKVSASAKIDSATASAVAPQGPAPVQPSAVAATAAKDTSDPKDTPHTAATAIAAVPPQTQTPAALPGDTAVPATSPIGAVHTPVALTTLSNPGGPALASTASTTGTSSLGGDTVPHTTLASTPTTLEVGVSSGTHGWLKIRAELNASGTVDASLSGTNAMATGRLHNDLPALSSFLQNEKVILGSLNVAAPSASASALHATAAATLEPVSAFTRSAAEAVGATGTAVASDAGTPGGRAPQQEAPQAHPPLANLPEGDGLAGAVTAPALYGDTNDLGNTGALASGSYNGGGSWLNVRV